MSVATYFKFSAGVFIVSLIANFSVLILILIHLKNHSKASVQFKLFSSSIPILETFILVIYIFIANNALQLFPNINMVNTIVCDWSIRLVQLLDTLKLYSLNGLFVSSYFHSLKLKGNILLICMFMIALSVIIPMELNNTFRHIIVYASDNHNIKRCGLPSDSESGHIMFSTKYAMQCVFDLWYMIMGKKRNIIDNKILSATSLLLISHLISAMFTSIIEIAYTFTVICQSIFILCVCWRNDNSTSNDSLMVSLHQESVQNTILFDISITDKYIRSCSVIYETLLYIFNSTNICYTNAVAKLIAEYASTMYSCCISCGQKFGIVECYKDYALHYGAIAVLDENENVRYYVDSEPTSWSLCKAEDSFDTEIEIVCIQCYSKLKCSSCGLQMGMAECVVCQSTICADCSTYEEDDTICKKCDNDKTPVIVNSNEDPTKWKFDQFTFD